MGKMLQFVTYGDETGDVAAAGGIELGQTEVGFDAEGHAHGKLIAYHGLNAGVETVCAGFVEGFLFVIKAFGAGAFGVALGFLLACDAVGHVGAGTEHDIARFAGAQVVGKEEGQLQVVLRGGTVHNAHDGFAGFFVEQLVTFFVEHVD